MSSTDPILLFGFTMSTSETSSKSGASFLWVLWAFVGFAALFFLVQALFGTEMVTDPRSSDRLVIKGEILAEQNALIAKMGLTDETKRMALFAKATEEVKDRKAVKSAFLVPGSPTQLKQMAEGAAPPSADGATATTPAVPAKP